MHKTSKSKNSQSSVPDQKHIQLISLVTIIYNEHLTYSKYNACFFCTIKSSTIKYNSGLITHFNRLSTYEQFEYNPTTEYSLGSFVGTTF